MIINYIKHEVRTNTMEVSWIDIELDDEGTPVREVQTRCQNYAREQVADFLADAPEGLPFAQAAGWA